MSKFSDSESNLRKEIFALMDSLDILYYVEEGMVFAETPEGELWTFTIPHRLYD